MRKRIRNIIFKELIWLFLIMVLSVLIEFSIIELFDLHPVLSIKIQGFIGLMIIGYAVRMLARINLAIEDKADPRTNGRKILE